MKRLLIICFMALAMVACSNSHPTFHDNKGQAIRFSDLRGKWVIINYWATWCHSCIEEIPQLNAFYESHRDHAIVLGVNYDMPAPTILDRDIKKLGIIYPVLTQDPRKFLHLTDAGVIPSTYLINPQGTRRLYRQYEEH